jgi:uncharacterized phage-associated protein
MFLWSVSYGASWRMPMPEATAQRVADYIVHFSHEHGDLITNLKLQKLVYYAQAWFLALYDKPLFDDRLEAWVHGPVQPSLYHHYKKYSWNPIHDDPGTVEFPAWISEHLSEVMTVYGGMSAYDLERLTHQEAPWLKARGELPKDEPSDAVISTEDMKAFYRDMAEDNEEDKGTQRPTGTCRSN